MPLYPRVSALDIAAEPFVDGERHRFRWRACKRLKWRQSGRADLELFANRWAVLVKRLDGTDGIIDLMFSRCIVQPGVAAREHLIVELKRPSVKIGRKEADQIESYANAIAEDERFKGTNTRWIMWVISTDVDRDIVRRSSQQNRPTGILHQPDDLPITVWVKTWAQIIEDASSRMRFFEERISYTPDRDASLAHLKTTYAKHVTELFAKVEGSQPIKPTDEDTLNSPSKPEFGQGRK